MSLQPPVNNRLGDSVGRLGAALVSNLVGSAILLVCFAAVLLFGDVGGSRGPAGLLEVPWWQLVGGLTGGAWVVASVVAVGQVGAGTVAAAAISGQLVAALAIDQFGLLGIERQPVTVARLAGVVLLVAGTLLIARRKPVPPGARRDTGSENAGERHHFWLIVLILGIGLSMGFQHPLNALLADTVGDVTSALTNFITGTALLLALVAFTGQLSRVSGLKGVRPLYLIGGLVGVIVVIASLAAVRQIGATVLFAGLVTGQLVGSLALDRAGAFGLERRPLDMCRSAGLLLLLAGTVLAVA